MVFNLLFVFHSSLVWELYDLTLCTLKDSLFYPFDVKFSFNPLNPHDASKQYFSYVKKDLVSYLYYIYA